MTNNCDHQYLRFKLNQLNKRLFKNTEKRIESMNIPFYEILGEKLIRIRIATINLGDNDSESERISNDFVKNIRNCEPKQQDFLDEWVRRNLVESHRVISQPVVVPADD